MSDIQHKGQLKRDFTKSNGAIYRAPEDIAPKDTAPAVSNADHHVQNAFGLRPPVAHTGPNVNDLLKKSFAAVSDTVQKIKDTPRSDFPDKLDKTVPEYLFGKKESETTANEPAPIEDKSLNSNGVKVHAVYLPEINKKDLGEPVLKTVAAPTFEDIKLETKLNALGDGYNVQEEIRRLKENDGHQFGSEHDQTYYKQAQYNIVGRIQAENGVKPDGIADADAIALIDQRLAENGITVTSRPAENTVQNFEGYQSRLRQKIETSHESDRTIFRGDRGENVRDVQAALSRLNPDYAKILNENGGVDGIFGQKTLDAIHLFQKRHGLEKADILTHEQINMLEEKAANVWVTHSQSASHEVSSPVNATTATQNLLDYIGEHESGGDYNVTYGEKAFQGKFNLTDMTINEVQQLQKSLVNNGSPSSAMGKYQIISKTMNGLVEEMGLTGNEKFDEAMQEKMGLQLLNGRGLDSHAISKEWASMPKDSSGLSYYHGDGLNKASGEWTTFNNLVEQARNPEQEIKVAVAPQTPQAPSL